MNNGEDPKVSFDWKMMLEMASQKMMFDAMASVTESDEDKKAVQLQRRIFNAFLNRGIPFATTLDLLMEVSQIIKEEME